MSDDSVAAISHLCDLPVTLGDADSVTRLFQIDAGDSVAIVVVTVSKNGEGRVKTHTSVIGGSTEEEKEEGGRVGFCPDVESDHVNEVYADEGRRRK